MYIEQLQRRAIYIVMVCLKLMIIYFVLVNVSGNQCEEKEVLSFVACDNVIEDQCNYSVTLSQVFDILEACEMLTDSEPNHQYSSIYCNSTCYYSVEILFGSDYTLLENYTLIGLNNVLFGSLDTYTFTIRCTSILDNNVMNTGFTFIAVRNFTIENLNIIGCGTKHVSTSQFEVGVFVMFYAALLIQNSTDVVLNNVIISNSNGIGLSIIDSNGVVEITDSVFSNNTLKSSETSRYLTGGGGIYIELTECTPGLTNCNPVDNLFNKNALYTITNCSFIFNDARHNFSRFDLVAETYVIFGNGGGLLMFLFGQALNNTLYVYSSDFISNKANNGGGLSIDGRQNASNNSVSISDCTFYSNAAFVYAGGGASIGFTIYPNGGRTMHNHFVIRNCLFEQNKSPNGVGGGLSWYGSNEPLQPTNLFIITNSTFVGNKAQYGFAMQVNKDFSYFIANGTILTLIIADCIFSNNGVESAATSQFAS